MMFAFGRSLPAFFVVLAVSLVTLAGCGRAAPVEPGLRRIPLGIVTADGIRHSYDVEIAATADEQALGLMYRRGMARDRGMIFPFSPPRPATFWMANTYIPLDMIFVTSDRRIESILADVPPLTEDQRASLGRVAAVLELNAGEAARIGAAAGDKVEYDLGDLQAHPN